MKVSAGDPNSNICKLEIELPWELAKAVADNAGMILAALNAVVQARGLITVEKQAASDETEKLAATNKAAWAKIYASCEAEIVRRSSGPSSNTPGLVKQLAAEQGITAELLTVILRVHRRDAKAAAKREGQTEVLRLYRQGHSQIEIARRLGVTTRRVRQILDQIEDASAPGPGSR